MANKTVYPYGQDGQLPSGYPIADDLNTNSAQQALSAKQGKVIGDIIYEDTYIAKNLSSYTEQQYSLGESNWKSTGKHRAIPVTPGDVLRLSIYSTEVSGAFYGFFTDAYVVPTSTSSARPYVTGTDRVWIGVSESVFEEQGFANKSVEITTPATAAYLIICPQDGNQKKSSWTVEDKTTGYRFIEKSDIVNNLVDGGANVPLSAEMGKQIGADLNKVFYPESVAIPETAVNWMINSQNKWQNAGLHKAVSVTPGDRIRIKSYNSQQSGNFYAFLTSLYTVPPVAGSDAQYAAGETGRYYATDAEGWIELTVPSNAAWLYLVFKNGDNYTSEWAVERIASMSTTEAFQQYVWKEDDGYVKHGYSGPLVNASEKHYVSSSKVATVTSQSFQGGACFGNYLFMFTENNTTCWIYDLSTNTLLQTYTIPSAERGFVSNCHCNTVNFGTEYYDDGDSFPLIYVSTGYASEGYTGVLVYRIIETTENDITTYSLSLVQTLKIPGTGWTEFIVGDDGDCFIKDGSHGFLGYYRMAMPTLSQGDITFDLSDALGVCKITSQPSWYNGSRNQCHIYYNGKIYLVSGVPASSEASLFISINLATGVREVEIDLYNTLGLTSEPEALFIWNDHFCIAFRSNNGIYALYFD